MLFRETPNMQKSSEWHFSKVRCENWAIYNKELNLLNSSENVDYVDMHE